MKTQPLFLTVVATITLTFFAAIAGAEQPRMDNAIDLLQSAKTVEKPLPVLKAAKEALQKAARNKKGHRIEAIGLVDEAIAEAVTGNHDKMVQKVNHAISQIHAGKDVGGGH
ncbi:MAG: hypothetical protein QOD99_2125 [Chthoniobacter sp.]|jgi:hypothetical protein|nr:hypothetical protein [Chthoniobacter sp.]